MVRQRLNIRFHNPNPMAETAERIAQIFIQASRLKFERLFAAYAENTATDKTEGSGH